MRQTIKQRVSPPHVLRIFRVTLQGDKGRYKVKTSARDAETARAIVCKAEGAPLSAVIKITDLRQIQGAK